MKKKTFNILLKKSQRSTKAVAELYDYFSARIILFLTPRFGRLIAEDATQEFFLNLPSIAASQIWIEYT